MRPIITYRCSAVIVAIKKLLPKGEVFLPSELKWLKCFIFRLLLNDPFMISFRFKQHISFMRSPHSMQPIYENLRAISCLRTTFPLVQIFVNLYFTLFFSDNTHGSIPKKCLVMRGKTSFLSEVNMKLWIQFMRCQVDIGTYKRIVDRVTISPCL